MNPHRNVFITALILVMSGCESSSNSNQQPASNNVGEQTSDSEDEIKTTAPKKCVYGNMVRLEAKPMIKECVDSGFLFNFAGGTCSKIKNESLPCSISSVQAKMKELGIESTFIDGLSQSESKFWGCGITADKNRIVTQIFTNLPKKEVDLCAQALLGVNSDKFDENADEPIDSKDDSDPDAIVFTIGCYTFYEDSEPPPPPKTKGEAQALVSSCLMNN